MGVHESDGSADVFADGGERLFVPGRLCLFGEHSDWASERGDHPGYCIVTGTKQGLRATAERADRLIVESPAPDRSGRPGAPVRRIELPWDGVALGAAAADELEFFRYCAGTASVMLSKYDLPAGVHLRIESMDLPLKKGVASSAAVCILVARAFDAVYGLNLFPHELMDAAYLGERLTGSECGRMDQACIYGRTPVLLAMSPQRGVRVEPIRPRRDVHLLFVDLAGHKDTVAILTALQRAHATSPDLRRALGPDNEGIVRGAYRALGDGDAAGLGSLMTEAQALFDARVAPHCPAELAGPLLHEVLSFDAIAGDVYGGKGVGSQGDGTAQFVARDRASRDAAMRKISEAFPSMRCFPLTIESPWREER